MPKWSHKNLKINKKTQPDAEIMAKCCQHATTIVRMQSKNNSKMLPKRARNAPNIKPMIYWLLPTANQPYSHLATVSSCLMHA